MSDDDVLKLLIGVASAFAGWLLAQFTSAAKSWLQRKKIKKLLLEELGDLKLEVNRLLLFYGRQLQIHGAKVIGNSSTTGLSNHIFKNYYKDALLSLNQSQRISYQLIHSIVDEVNSGIREFREMTVDIQEEHFANGMSPKISKAGEGWGKKVMAEYQHCASLLWQLEHHLRHKKLPDLSPDSKHHAHFLAYLEEAKTQAAKLIQSGANMGRTAFE